MTTEDNNKNTFTRFITDKVNAEGILEMLHRFIDGQKPHDAVMVIKCAYDMHLLIPVSIPILKQEFESIGSINWARTLLRTMNSTDFTPVEYTITKTHMKNYLTHKNIVLP